MNDESLAAWEPEQLLARCREVKPDNSHERFCFELFRGAIQRRSERCWALLYSQYQKLVLRWTLEAMHTNSEAIEGTAEEFVVESFAAFWRAFTVDKLESANGIGSVLSYLKSCAVTTVLQARRKGQRRHQQAAWDDTVVESQRAIGEGLEPHQQVVAESYAAQLWQLVDSSCHDEAERIVARLSFVADLKPHAILERHPDHFSDVAEIYAIRRNLKNRLLRHPALYQLWKEGTE